jgi:hypothetical protein
MRMESLLARRSKPARLYNKPTLKKLEVRFEENKVAKQVHKQRVKDAIDLTLKDVPACP